MINRAMSLIIFTDLDGTLLNQEDYNYQAAVPVLERLKTLQIPVIPVTSKTRSEVEFLRQEIGLSDPFIVENGSGIFIPVDDRRFPIGDRSQSGEYYLQLLGCTYVEARLGLAKVAASLGENLRGFGDLSAAEVEKLTGLPVEEVKLAQAREFTEPFVTPSHFDSETIAKVAATEGFRVLVGDRFSHLIGAGAGKGKAVQWLMKNYRSTESDRQVTTIGLGNSPNDLEMLEAVDIPIVISSRQGVHPGLKDRGWQVPSSPGSQGWAEAISSYI